MLTDVVLRTISNKVRDYFVDPNPGLWIDRLDAISRNQSAFIDEDVRSISNDLIVSGVGIVKSSVTTDLCDKAVAHYQKFARTLSKQTLDTSPEENGITYPRIVNLHSQSEIFRQLFTRNRSLSVIDHCFGKKATVYTSLTFQVGTQQPIHRDIPVFRTSPDARYFGMWVALEDVDDNNGPLMVIRKGHRTALVDPYALAQSLCPNLKNMSNEDLQKEMWEPYQEKIHAKCLEQGLSIDKIQVRKGDTVIWHALLPHGGSKILDAKRTRYSCVFHVVPGRTPVYQADVFFKKDVPAPFHWGRRYSEFENRQFMESPPACFMR